MKIPARLALAFGILAFLVLGLNIHSVAHGKESKTLFEDVLRMNKNRSEVNKLMRYVFEGRMNAWGAVVSKGGDKWKDSQESMAVAFEIASSLELSLKNPERKKNMTEMKKLIESYLDLERKMMKLKREETSMESLPFLDALAEAGRIGRTLDGLGKAFEESYAVSAEGASTKYNESIDNFINISIIFSFAFMVLVAGIGFSVFYYIAPPIKNMTRAMAELAAGNLGVEIPSAKKKDEIGAMAKAVQVFKENAIRVETYRREQENFAQISAEEKKKVLLELADQFEQSVMDVVRHAATSAAELRTTAEAMTVVVHQTTMQASTVETAAQATTENVQTVATAAEELSASIAEIGRQVQDAARVSVEAAREADQTNSRVQSLSESANKIGNIITLINGIASQTNLLALNATIEAARAGEAGKGFAVVASEVKSLAKQTAKATEEIGDQIALVQLETKNTVSAIHQISSIIQKVQNISSDIASAVEQQSSATQDIARHVQEAATGTQKVSGTIGEVRQAATSAGGAASHVLTCAEDLAKSSDHLEAEVHRFLNKVRSA